VRWPRRRERALFSTHEPPFRCSAWAIGEMVQHEGKLYRVTRWVELRPVRLERGGSVGQWEIWGRRVPDKEVRRMLLDAADQIKNEGGKS
jgi:hypothetical protein